MCGLVIETDGDTVRSIRGDDADPLSQGYLCPKAPALKALHEDPDRLRQPVKRVGEQFVPIDWDEAYELAAEGIHRVQQQHGRDAMAIYLGNPTVHSPGAAMFGPMLVRALRTKNRFSATSVDQLPHHLAAHWMFGHQFLLPIPDVDRTEHLLVIGANPLASNGSLMSAPGMRGRVKKIQDRGGRVVVIDPRRTETAEVADAHHPIRPGTDAWMLAALTRYTLTHGRGPGHVAAHTRNLEALRKAMEPFTFARAAERTGISEAALEAMAKALCEAERAVVYGRMGVSTQRFGSLCQWLVNCLNVLTGNFDREGGAMFPSPAIDIVDAPFGFGVGRGSYGRWRSRVRGLPEHNGELPVVVLAEEMLTEGEGQIRGIVTSAGNPVLSTPNGAQLDRAMAALEHVVSIDFYINETTRHANVILPPVSPLERPHYDVAFHQLAVRNTAKYADALFDAGPDARQEWQIVLGLVKRLLEKRGRYDLKARARHLTMSRLGVKGLLDLGLRLGPHGMRRSPKDGLSLHRLREQPHGVDLGPMVPRLPARFTAHQDFLDLAPEPLVKDLARLSAESPVEGLSLIGRRHLRSNNSWMHNVPKLMAGKPICVLQMHPDDAAARGLADGDVARVSSRVGAVEVPIEITDAVMPGVVSLPHGFGHGRPGTRLRVAAEHAGVSINDLTDDDAIDTLSGNAVLNGTPVEVASVAAAQ